MHLMNISILHFILWLWVGGGGCTWEVLNKNYNMVMTRNSYLQACSKNELGNTQQAKNYGRLALCWNIAVIIYRVILWIIIIAIIAVFARGGPSNAAASSGGNSGSESTCTYVLTQVCYTYSCGYKYVYRCSWITPSKLSRQYFIL